MLLGISPGCGTAPASQDKARSGLRVVVNLLDADFVRYAGSRMPMEDFFYEIRLLCREAFDQGISVPWIEVHVPPGGGAVTNATFERLQKGMWDAGVQLIDPK